MPTPLELLLTNLSAIEDEIRRWDKEGMPSEKDIKDLLPYIIKPREDWLKTLPAGEGANLNAEDQAIYERSKIVEHVVGAAFFAHKGPDMKKLYDDAIKDFNNSMGLRSHQKFGR